LDEVEQCPERNQYSIRRKEKEMLVRSGGTSGQFLGADSAEGLPAIPAAAGRCRCLLGAVGAAEEAGAGAPNVKPGAAAAAEAVGPPAPAMGLGVSQATHAAAPTALWTLQTAHSHPSFGRWNAAQQPVGHTEPSHESGGWMSQSKKMR